MGKSISVKKISAVIFYMIGITVLIYIASIILNSNFSFDLDGLIISSLFVVTPIIIATFLLISSYNDIETKFKIMNKFVLIIFIFYIILLISILFRSGYRNIIAFNEKNLKHSIKMNLNLIPFKTIINYINYYINDTINKSIVIQNLLGNLLLFAPMGVLLPSIFRELESFSKFIVSMLLILFGVEIIQLLLCVGSFDIDDIILNLLGSLIFYKLFKLKITKGILTKLYVIK